MVQGRRALIEDGVAGATRFKDGLGRHGDFEKIRHTITRVDIVMLLGVAARPRHG
jgi:hypothetical protein